MDYCCSGRRRRRPLRLAKQRYSLHQAVGAGVLDRPNSNNPYFCLFFMSLRGAKWIITIRAAECRPYKIRKTALLLPLSLPCRGGILPPALYFATTLMTLITK